MEDHESPDHDRHICNVECRSLFKINTVSLHKIRIPILYLINPNIVYLNSRILHSNGNDIVILRMECQIGSSRRRRHECCHDLGKFENVKLILIL